MELETGRDNMSDGKKSGPTDIELLMMIARESYEKFGTALPPGFGRPNTVPRAPLKVGTVPPKPKKKIDWKKETHTCPKCGHTGRVDPDFGTRTVRGIVLRQSWCVTCRATTNYRNTGRKYNKAER